MNLTPQKIAWMTSTGQGPHPNFYINNIKKGKKAVSKNLRARHKRGQMALDKKGPRWKNAHYTDTYLDEAVPEIQRILDFTLGKPNQYPPWFKIPNIRWPNIKGSGFLALGASYAISAGLIIYGPAKFKLVGTALLAVPDILIYGAGEFLA